MMRDALVCPGAKRTSAKPPVRVALASGECVRIHPAHLGLLLAVYDAVVAGADAVLVTSSSLGDVIRHLSRRGFVRSVPAMLVVRVSAHHQRTEIAWALTRDGRQVVEHIMGLP